MTLSQENGNGGERRDPVPPALLRVVERAMAKDPGSRYPSAAEMARDIVNCRDALKSEVAGIFNIRNLFKTLRRLSVIVPGLIGLVAVASLAFMFSSRQAKVRWARGVALPEIRRLIGPTL